MAFAGVGGTVAGAALAVLQQKKFVGHCAGTAASCMVCMGAFAGLQESSRLLRCDDSAANSIVAGAAVGAVLLGLQRGRQASLPGAIVCGFAAGTVYTLDDKLQPLKIAKQWLAENDLIDLDKSEVKQRKEKWRQIKRPDDAPLTPNSSGNTWGDYFGIKSLTDEEWLLHEQQRKAKFEQRLSQAGLKPEDRMIRHTEHPE